MKISLNQKATASGVCLKCGKTLEWRPAPVSKLGSTTGCMMTAELYAQELQKSVAKNTKQCSECTSEVKNTLLKKIICIPSKINRRVLCFVRQKL